jgi:hypothetical protein
MRKPVQGASGGIAYGEIVKGSRSEGEGSAGWAREGSRAMSLTSR